MLRAVGSRGLMSAAEESFVSVAKRGACLSLTLTRTKALNSLTLPMVRDLMAAYEKAGADGSIKCMLLEGTGKAFCAGGDVKAVCVAAQDSNSQLTDSFFREEYALNAAIAGCPKPQVSLWDGIVMGGGAGLSVHGSHRIATEKTMFAMPETNIGLFPDVGGSFFLSQLPGAIGPYIGLTGARLNGADLLYCGLATHHVASEALPELTDALGSCNSAADVDALLSRLSSPPPGESSLEVHREQIDSAFALDSVEAIVAKLQAMASVNSQFASETLSTLSKMSPTSMKLTLRLVSEARASASAGGAPLSECLRREYRVVQRCVTPGKTTGSDDFFEGIRAALVDKDRNPQWLPKSVDAVSDESIAAYFAPLGEKELSLPRLPGFGAP